MAETDLTPYLNELMKETGILFKVFEKHVGRRMEMPNAIRTATDKSNPEVHSQLKMAMLAQLAGAFVDKQFPNIRAEKGEAFRGEIVMRLSLEIYRFLTDGLTIDAMRMVIGDPDPYNIPKGIMQ